jgi:hypothetical protein
MLCTEEITIIFEEPFWIALIERYNEKNYSVAKLVIDTSEPQGVHLLDFFSNLDDERLQFTSAVPIEKRNIKTLSFKKQMHKNKHTQASTSKHVYTKAHSMLKEQQSQHKTERKKESQFEKEKFNQVKYELKQQKKKNKHRGH